MAKKPKKSSLKSSASTPTVVRIKASESAPKKSADKVKTAKVAKEVVVTKPVTSEKKPRTRNAKGILRPFIAFVNYFKGAWFELRQVRWPNRRATWSLTGAVLAYSAFFVVLVLLLDAAFKYLFELILGK